MSDIRIKDLPETLDVESDDYVAVDNAGDGTRKYTLRQLIASVGAPEFVVNINASGDADKTLSDITGAIASGYIPVAVYNDEYYQLTKTTGTSATFTKYNELGEMVSIIVGDGYTEVREDTLTTNNVFNYSGVPGENVSYALDDLSNNIGYLSDRVNDATNDVRDMRDDVADLDFRVDILEASGGGSSGDGLTQTEKNLILTLFSKAAYAADDAGNAYDELEGLWATVERTITYNLSHVASSNTDTSIISGSLYATTFGVQDNYTLNIVEVTMGGEDITSTAYRNGTITIPRVTGNIVITATAVLAAQSITAVYTQSGTVYDTDSLDSLKADLAVTANYAGGTSEVVPSTDYTLSGTLAVGTSAVTVSYAGQTTSFNVTVSEWSTAPRIAQYDANHNMDGTTGDVTGLCITEKYWFTLDMEALKATNWYDSTNDYFTTSGIPIKLTACFPNTNGASGFQANNKTNYYKTTSDARFGYSSVTFGTSEVVIQTARQSTAYTNLPEDKIGISFTLSTNNIDNSYVYWSLYSGCPAPLGVSDGDIIFAGANTPYYGMHNISEASS